MISAASLRGTTCRAGHSLTVEQQNAIDTVDYAVRRDRRHVVTYAYAGGGKTFILTRIAQQIPGNGIYMAFNDAIVRDIKGKLPKRVLAMTSHQFALCGLPPDFSLAVRNSLKEHGGQIAGPQIVQVLRLQSFYAHHLDIPAHAIAGLARRTVTQFCNSADLQIEEKHLPALPNVPGVRPAILDAARRLWDAQIRLALPIGHDIYFKAWSLSGPALPGDFRLVDEAQDTNPALASVLFGQRRGQTVWTGDPYQGIYGWRGARDAMLMAREQDALTARLTRSFRFGEETAAAATRLLGTLGETHPVLGTGSTKIQQAPDGLTPSRVAELVKGQQFAWIAFSNGALIAAATDCAIHDIPFHIVGSGKEEQRLIYAAMSLRGDKYDANGPLAGYHHWSELEEDAEAFPNSEAGRLLKISRFPGFGTVLDALKRSEKTESTARVILTTAHRSKGREWDLVVLDSDLDATNDNPKSGRRFFTENGRLRFDNKEDIHLRYVAATRARKRLVVACPELYRWLTC